MQCRKRLNEDGFLRTELVQAARRMGQEGGVTTLAILLRISESTIDPIGRYLLEAFVCGVVETEEMRQRLRGLVPGVAAELAKQMRRREG